MRVGTVVGRVTLSRRHTAYRGERLMLVLPWTSETFRSGTGWSYSVVAYDELGAGPGQVVALSEGREAACPFPVPCPVDAYCAALIDEIHHQDAPPAGRTRKSSNNQNKRNP